MTSWVPSVLAWVRSSGAKSLSEAGSNFWHRSVISYHLCFEHLVSRKRENSTMSRYWQRERRSLMTCRCSDCSQTRSRRGLWSGLLITLESTYTLCIRSSSQKDSRSIQCEAAIGLEEFNFLMVLGKGSFGKAREIKFYLSQKIPICF